MMFCLAVSGFRTWKVEFRDQCGRASFWSLAICVTLAEPGVRTSQHGSDRREKVPGTHFWVLAGILGTMQAVTHRDAEERSLALHREVARRLRGKPELLEVARERVRGWLESGFVSRTWAEAWDDVLAGSLEGGIARITDPSERSRDLRQTSPFAGAIEPRARWEVLRRLRQRRVSA